MRLPRLASSSVTSRDDIFVANAGWIWRNLAENLRIMASSGLFQAGVLLDQFLLAIAGKADRHLGLVA